MGAPVRITGYDLAYLRPGDQVHAHASWLRVRARPSPASPRQVAVTQEDGHPATLSWQKLGPEVLLVPGPERLAGLGMPFWGHPWVTQPHTSAQHTVALSAGGQLRLGLHRSTLNGPVQDQAHPGPPGSGPAGAAGRDGHLWLSMPGRAIRLARGASGGLRYDLQFRLEVAASLDGGLSPAGQSLTGATCEGRLPDDTGALWAQLLADHLNLDTPHLPLLELLADDWPAPLRQLADLIHVLDPNRHASTGSS